MANKYNPAVAESKIDNLISGTQIPLKVIAGELAAAVDLERGTPLTCNPATGLWEAAVNSIDGVLLDDLTDGATVFAVAVTGEFNENVMDLDALADSDRSIIEARAKQIYIAPSHQAPYVQRGE